MRTRIITQTVQHYQHELPVSFSDNLVRLTFMCFQILPNSKIFLHSAPCPLHLQVYINTTEFWKEGKKEV